MSLHQALLLYMPDKIKHLLGPAHCEGRDYDIASPIQGALDNVSKLSHMIQPLFMMSVTVSGLHDHIIGLLDVLRIPDEGLVLVSYVSGKYDLS